MFRIKSNFLSFQFKKLEKERNKTKIQNRKKEVAGTKKN